MEQEDKEAEERIKERKIEAIDRVAMFVFGISQASPRPLTPAKAYEAAEQFVNFVQKRNPKSDFRSF